MIRCSSEKRRLLLRNSGKFGIDFIELDPDDRRRLLVYLIDVKEADQVAAAAANIRKRDLVITGGFRRTVSATRGPIPEDDHLVVEVDQIGDRSDYALTIEHRDFDQRLNRCAFSFATTCRSIEDCRTEDFCPPERDDEPLIDYHSKDYDTFRRQLIDHLAVNLPAWSGAHPADFLTTVVEAIAYESDRLSYRQDVIANERTLGGARMRQSASRHARLIGYDVDDGSSARTFIRAEVNAVVLVAPGSRVLTRVTDPTTAGEIAALGVSQGSKPVPAGLTSDQADIAARAADHVFTTMVVDRQRVGAQWRLDPTLNRVQLHTWADKDCCLPAGATEAVLVGDHRGQLTTGSYFLFQEVRGHAASVGDRNSAAREADPEQAFVVRLEAVSKLPDDPVTADGTTTQLTKITWDQRDALPRPLCISDSEIDEPIAYGFGNLILVEHGKPVTDQTFDLPQDFVADTVQHPLVYEQQLSDQPVLVSRSDSIPGQSDAEAWSNLPAAHHLSPAPKSGLARITLAAAGGSSFDDWAIRQTLLQSDEDARHFVAELSNLRQASLRFGDDTIGRRPVEVGAVGGSLAEVGVEFRAGFFTGLAETGNIGAEVLAHLEVRSGAGNISFVTNPVSAVGGRAPETLQQIKDRAPTKIRDVRRAVRLEDYDRFATELSDVQRARSRFEWTGSWSTVAVVADGQDAKELEANGRNALAREMESVRLAGYPVEIDQPTYVPLRIELDICVSSATDPWSVIREVRRALSAGCTSTGELGFFHPDRLSFGQPIWLSDVVAAAAEIQGVTQVKPRSFKRLFGTSSLLRRGVIEMGRFEIARADTDDSRPENGMVTVELVPS